MMEREELPEWTAGRAGEEPNSVGPRRGPQPDREGGRGRGVAIGLMALIALVGVGALGYYIAENRAETETATSNDPASPSVNSEAAGTDGTSGSDGAADDTAVAVDVSEESDDGAEDENAAGTDDGSSDSADGLDESGRTAVFRGGKLYLGGKVPSDDVATFIVERASAVVGPDNVVAEYEIDPTVVIDPGESTPLYVEDVVLFQFNSVEIDPPFIPLLELGVLLLSQNPQATLTVVTRTDAVGSEEVNLNVSRQRAEAVINYWLSRGVNSEQLKSDPRGEEGASESDDEQTSALQRRAEFIITGLLD